MHILKLIGAKTKEHSAYSDLNLFLNTCSKITANSVGTPPRPAP